jgi:hypothetical protein
LHTSFGIEIDQRIVVAKTRINFMINPTPNKEIKCTRLRTRGCLTGAIVKELEEYLDLIVQPTFDDYGRHPGSVRHAYLACLVAYHAIDRVTYPAKSQTLAQEWRKESMEFALNEEVALHLKHVKSNFAKDRFPPNTLLITHALGIQESGAGLETRNLHFLVRDLIKFLHSKVAPANAGSADETAESALRKIGPNETLARAP